MTIFTVLLVSATIILGTIPALYLVLHIFQGPIGRWVFPSEPPEDNYDTPTKSENPSYSL